VIDSALKLSQTVNEIEGVSLDDSSLVDNDKTEDNNNNKNKSSITNSTENTHHEEKMKLAQDAQQAEVCGGVSLVRIVNAKITLEGSENEKEKSTRYKSREAWQLGKWAVHNAARDHFFSHDHHHVYTLAPIYIEQDLYCLASSAGTNFSVWPPKEILNKIEKKQFYNKLADKKLAQKIEEGLEEMENAALLQQSEYGSL
jgi:hypothetical protein